MAPNPLQIEAWDSVSSEQQRQHLVESARRLSTYRSYRLNGRSFSRDCSGYVGAVLFENGIDVFRGASELEMTGNGVRLLHQFVTRYGSLSSDQAAVGDLVFFSNTYDRNRDGKFNDDMTHVGIIDGVDTDGTLHFLHHIHGRIKRYIMNFQLEGQNSYMRKRRKRDPKNAKYFAAELFSGFGSLARETLTDPSQSNTTSAL